ncbi:GNAT family N-acetyltransferase [Paenibacillus sepulcri]|uniref:GNAT family N-acetyltransferase n=1 Tax=Paenibacillus sepulcri TaxID=359917 RepID=A0ABS7C5L8_9BACL|nr:GNAT family N-acetyltransferase [Paenibacillus sepulcri]
MKIIRVSTPEERDKAYEVRRAVFVEEQGVPVEVEIDEFEDAAEHFVIIDGDRPVGAARLRLLGDTAKLERICVLMSHRKYGLGRDMVIAMEEVSKELGAVRAKLHGQTHAEPFYTKLGYQPASEIFMEEGIPHLLMVKTY